MNAEQASIALGKSGGGESGDEPVKPSDSTERVQVPFDQSVAGRSEASVAIGRVTGRWKRTQQGSRTWDNLVDQFFADYFSVRPSLGTYAGFHQYDSELEDYSQRGVDNEVIFANRYLERFEKFASNLLSAEQEQDRQFVISQIRARLLELRSIREWEKNPDVYSSGITQSAFGIMSRKFAPTIRERVDDPADEVAKRCEHG